MDHAKFGNSDLMVSPLGLGCMSMSGAYGVADDNESIASTRYPAENMDRLSR